MIINGSITACGIVSCFKKNLHAPLAVLAQGQLWPKTICRRVNQSFQEEELR